MGDAQAFLGQYRRTLEEGVASANWPPEVAAVYIPESCLKYSPNHQVYLVTDRRTGHPVILRVSEADPDERLDAEYAILSKLSCPGVPKAYGTMAKDGQVYLARQYFEVKPLDQVVVSGAMATSWIYSIGRQLCGLLGYLHSQTPPVIHRDIKPQNIILRPDGSVALTDFGIARTFKEGSSTDTEHFGTLPYAPPEQYGYAQSSAQTDIYALGIVLIYLATGSPDRRDLAGRIKDERLRAVIERCIAFDPKARFQNVEQVAKRLDSAQSRARRRATASTTAAAVAVAAAIGAWHPWIPGDAGLPGAAGTGAPTTTADPSAPTAPTAPAASAASAASTDLTPRHLRDVKSGNLAGNLLGGGIAVEGEGVIYVCDYWGVWEFDLNGQPSRHLSWADDVAGLNYWDGRIYYASTAGGLVRLDPSSAEETVLVEQPVRSLFIDGGRLYFEEALGDPSLQSIKPDGTDRRRETDRAGEQSVVYGGYRYFVDPADGGRLLRTNLDTAETTEVYGAPAAWPNPFGGRLYFADPSAGGAVVTSALDGSDASRLVEGVGAGATVVASGDRLIYLDGLGRLATAPLVGGSATVLTLNRVSGLSLAGDWVFYKNADDKDEVWMVRLDGADDHRFYAPVDLP
ncbi:MAG: DUF5050 domain-containing protein [Bifidobacteriaceae bacterium]|jgi:hypothetical protein|nr:DUF5050 domain-containing protein [Bifidobacteriaceae bacterium]